MPDKGHSHYRQDDPGRRDDLERGKRLEADRPVRHLDKVRNSVAGKLAAAAVATAEAANSQVHTEAEVEVDWAVEQEDRVGRQAGTGVHLMETREARRTHVRGG